MWQMQNMDGIVMIHVLQYLYTTMREICADIISLAQGFLIRHDEDGKMYLYDILRIKKETSEPA